jgi:hypothetical protein
MASKLKPSKYICDKCNYNGNNKIHFNKHDCKKVEEEVVKVEEVKVEEVKVEEVKVKKRVIMREEEVIKTDAEVKLMIIDYIKNLPWINDINELSLFKQKIISQFIKDMNCIDILDSIPTEEEMFGPYLKNLPWINNLEDPMIRLLFLTVIQHQELVWYMNYHINIIETENNVLTKKNKFYIDVIYKLQTKFLEVKQSNTNSLGLFVKNNVLTNKIVFTLKGEILPKPTRESIHIGDNKHIHDEYGKFINHSFTPNIYMDGPHVTSLMDIQAGDELVFNYNDSEINMAAPFMVDGIPVCGKGV